MAALLTGLMLFAVAWLVHLMWWRTRLPGNQMRALALVFAATLLAFLCAWLISGFQYPIRPVEMPAVALLYAAATACYLITYTGVEETSPSLVLIRALARRREAGCTRGELEALITDDMFVQPRIDALRRDGMLAESQGGFVLTEQGRRAARAAALIARMFNIRESA